jgi:NACalpha-BTF3-like transcription factor
VEGSPVNIIERALEELEKRGWVKGTIKDEEGHVCIEGALRCVTDDRTELKTAASYIEKAIRFLFPTRHWIRYQRFNDDKSISLEDVKLVLKHASASKEEMLEKIQELRASGLALIAEKRARHG